MLKTFGVLQDFDHVVILSPVNDEVEDECGIEEIIP
jgi:hypothetical protein